MWCALIAAGVLAAVLLFLLRKPALPRELAGCWVGTAAPGETAVRRDQTAAERLVDAPEQGYRTLHDLLESFPSKGQPRLVGYRDVLERKLLSGGAPDAKPLYSYKLSDYRWLSSEEFYVYVHRLANGLAALGLRPGDRVGFYCETRYEWLAMLFACSCRGLVVVTVYTTLGFDAVSLALQENAVKALFISAETHEKLPSLALGADVRLVSPDAIDDARVVAFSALLDAPKVADDVPAPDDLAMVIYTSGTSKEPKGVLIHQRNLLPITHSYYHKMGYSDATRYICYLPLAHVFELTIELCVLVWGGSLGFSSQRTLTSVYVHDSPCDLHAFNPTFMNGVPTVFNRIRKILRDKIARSPAHVRALFAAAEWVKQTFYVRAQLRPRALFAPLVWLVDEVVFARIRTELFGTGLTSIICGGSPLSRDLQEYLLVVLPGVDIMQGYGMTETSGAAICMAPGDYAYSTVGFLYPNFEAKLRDVDELNYSTAGPEPCGELLLRGPSVASGYLNRPDDTAATFTPDGWLCTGDIAQIAADGHIRIVDRKKNLIKQPCGEYVSLEKVETAYALSRFVDGICVIADNLHDFTVALVVPNRGCLKDFAAAAGADPDAALAGPAFAAAVLADMRGFEETLSRHERVARIAVVPDEWTPENDMLTAALKLKRKAIHARYAATIDGLFDGRL